jgi:hypothetical protein
VYVDRNPHPATYDRLVNFKLDTSWSDSEAVQHQRQIDSFLAEAPLKKWNTQGLPSQWIPMHLYKGEYMLYGFGDYGYNGKVLITDSLISYFGWMHTLARIDSFTQRKDGSYMISFSLSTQNSLPENRHDTMIIHIVDPARGISIFSNATMTHHTLMIDASKARLYPIIVNYTIRMKPPEFWDFDVPDFPKLLSSQK